ncbi:MAG TPA: cation diffusion facilitator family transporter [Candidatus Gastranaerophilales bacterium]|nr:cation diffusion facilitator family transporter [Candidatus Gastranaerophilales bacterium]
MSSDSYSNTNTEIHQTIIKTDNDANTENAYLIKESAVWRALFANLGIAAIKFVCWLISKSSAMLSESIHSAVDGFNSLCLIIGLKRGRKPADRFHPFGYGLEANIWALFACIFMLIGTAVAFYHGFNKLLYHHNDVQELLDNYALIAVTLVLSIFFELWAVSSASKAVVAEAGAQTNGRFDTFIKSVKLVSQIKSPTTKFVWYEDTAALLGVIVALIALTVSKFFIISSYAYIPDAIASLIIGLLLFGLAIYLLKYNVSFLTGASAKPDIEESIKKIAENVHGISEVIDLKTIDMGSSGLIVNLEIEVDPEIQVKDADDIADKLEEKLKEKIKNISHITIEVQANDAEEDWREKLDKIIEDGKQNDILNPSEARMLSRFFDFTTTVVKEIMIPRTDVVFINSESGIDEFIDIVLDSGYTRIPVYEENIDNIIGIANAKEVLKLFRNGCNKNEIKIRKLARETIIIPENKSISGLLNEFIRKKTQMAIIVDEHGGVAGIVTVEDILEEIVGEIWDEYDVRIPEVAQLDKNTLNVFSKVSVYDLNERFNLDLPLEDFQTIGGLIFGQLGREPEIGDEISVGDVTMKVESMDGHKIVKAVLYREDGFIDSHFLEEDYMRP